MNINKNILGATGLAPILLIAALLLGGTGLYATFIGTSEDLSEDAQIMTENILEEFSTFVEIKDVIGKVYNKENSLFLEKIVVLFKIIFSFFIANFFAFL